MTSKPLIIIHNITEDIAVLCYGSSRVLVKNGNINEGVSSSKTLHASSIHIHEFTSKRTKQSMKNWTRYSLSKIYKNESDRNHVTAESHGNDNNPYYVISHWSLRHTCQAVTAGNPRKLLRQLFLHSTIFSDYCHIQCKQL